LTFICSTHILWLKNNHWRLIIRTHMKKLYWTLIFSAFFFALVINPPAFAVPSLEGMGSITGFWRTQDGDGVVEIYACGQKLCGRFHWLKEDSPENPSLDNKNPDPEMKSRPLCEMQFMGGCAPQPGARATGGWIYSPHHGSTFSAEMKLANADTLELRGYMLIPLLGESQTWKRINAPPACATAHAHK